MAEPAHILVVDDDDRLRALLSRYLTGEGFRVTVAANAAEARSSLEVIAPDLIVLDVMMPHESGLALTEALRQEQEMLPILLLTARGAPEDRIAGLEVGADDYLGKPFDPRELLLRIRALLRRATPRAAAPGLAPLQFGLARFDPDRGSLSGPDGPIHLTSGEAALLATLAGRPGNVFSREELAQVLGIDESSERAIDVHVTRLRRKLEPDSREPRFLHTVRGRGYMLKPGS